jgi:mono/diheme cytochrome c family protein
MTTRLLLIGFVLLASGAIVRASWPQDDPKTLYDDNCAKCHGVRGLPPKTMKAKFPKIFTFDATFVTSHSEDSIVKVLTRGKDEDMVSFKDKLTPDQMKIVAKYVRALGSK